MKKLKLHITILIQVLLFFVGGSFAQGLDLHSNLTESENVICLDEIVFDVAKQGVKSWICLSYGNSIYDGGDGTTLNVVVPKLGKALNELKDFVEVILKRYGDVVDEWKIWNNLNFYIDDCVNLLTINVEIIHKEYPDATVIVFPGLIAEKSILQMIPNEKINFKLK